MNRISNIKNVSIIYGYSAKNAGDFAITLGAIDILIDRGVNIKIFSRYCGKDKEFLTSKNALDIRYGNRIEIYESPFSLNRSGNFIINLKSYIDGFFSILGINKKTTFNRIFLQSDLVIFNGGNLFRCNSFIDFARLHALMYPLHKAISANIPFIIFPQSASKLNRLGRKLLLPVLSKSECVFIREKDSYNYLSGFISSSNFIQTIDLAFFINKINLNNIKRKHRIALTLRFHSVGDIHDLSKYEVDKICCYLGSFVEILRSKYEFIVVAQTDKDEIKSKEFSYKYGINYIKSNDIDELLKIYNSVKLLIGMRLHSIILALSVGTPCFGVFVKEWGLKNSGIMKYFDMPYRMLDDDSSNNIDEDVDAIKHLLENLNETSLKIQDKIKIEKKLFIDKIKSIL